MDHPNSPVPEYGWENIGATSAHDVLLPVLKNILVSNHKMEDAGKIKIFDAGCGNGFIAGKLIELGYNVAGCDTSSNGIAGIRKIYPEGDFRLASVYDDLPHCFGNDWDIVISLEVVEHLYNPGLFANNIFGMLKPGGLLIISTPYHGYLKNLAMAITGRLERHFTALWDGGHIKFWSFNTLKTLLERAGFSYISFYGTGRVPWLWKSMVISAVKKQKVS